MTGTRLKALGIAIAFFASGLIIATVILQGFNYSQAIVRMLYVAGGVLVLIGTFIGSSTSK